MTPPTIERLIEQHSKRLLNRAYYLLSNKQDAEDLVQEVFVVAYHKREALVALDSVEAWLMGVLHHKVADRYKERYRKPLVGINFEHDFDQNGEWKQAEATNVWADNPEDLDSLLDDPEFRQSFYGCLDHLPPRWQIAIKLCYLRGKSGPEVCSELNISSANYWKVLQRSRLQLRECVETNWFKRP